MSQEDCPNSQRFDIVGGPDLLRFLLAFGEPTVPAINSDNPTPRITTFEIDDGGDLADVHVYVASLHRCDEDDYTLFKFSGTCAGEIAGLVARSGKPGQAMQVMRISSSVRSPPTISALGNALR